ncbi:hypothetical protein [Pseudoalteromonas phenolica]|nr:hypothetical protein [Pseudoalteromonas phenolica]MBE0357356.1 hypothetical protein [Pseudoalteromonas phenolica O-BC30]
MKFMHSVLFTCFIFLLGCSPNWREAPYEVYIIDGTKSLGYALGNGGYIGRIDEPVNIASDETFLSVYACPKNVCGFYYIDKRNDHKYAEAQDVVFGPLSEEQFLSLHIELGVPHLQSD